MGARPGTPIALRATMVGLTKKHTAICVLVFLALVRTEARQTFKTGVDMVPLTVTVTDTAGNYKTGLTIADFSILEDGVPQSLSFFTNEHVPADVALVIDTSSSMSSMLPLVKTAARGLIRSLHDGDRGMIVDVKSSIRFLLPLTAEHAAVEAAIRISRCGTSAA